MRKGCCQILSQPVENGAVHRVVASCRGIDGAAQDMSPANAHYGRISLECLPEVLYGLGSTMEPWPLKLSEQDLREDLT